MIKKLTLLSCLVVFSFSNDLMAQSKKKDKKKASTEKVMPEAKKPDSKKEPKPYKKVIDSTAVTQKGLIDVHKVADKYLFEISDSLIGKEIMTITRYSKTPAGGGIFGGEEINRQVVRFEKGQNNTIILRSITYVIMTPDEDKPITQSVKNSSADPIIGIYDILAYKKDASGKNNAASVIDMTSAFESDTQIFSLNSVNKQLLSLQAFQKDKSFIQFVKSFPINTEVRTTKTFTTVAPQISRTPTPRIGVNLPAGLDAGVVTMEINTSFILLPENPMRKRAFDKRVGYFANGYDVFEEDSQKAETEIFAVRWRLEPKNAEDAEKQKRGELIEPKKPIVYYLDPATPDKWKPFIKQGIDDWQEAFEFAAYQTLYTCLVTVAKLSAPIAPFFMDKLYRDLTQATGSESFESVHLAKFPVSVENFVDKSLESKMLKAQTVSSLVLSLRKKEMIKVRQPLQRVMIPVLDDNQRAEIEAVSDLIMAEVNVKEVELLDDASGVLVKQIKPNFKTLGPRFGKDMGLISKEIQNFGQEQIAKLERDGELVMEIAGKSITLSQDDVEISSQDIPGWLVANSNGITVALDITISDELRKEGIARELINRIQNIRKDSGFEVTDKITVKMEKNAQVEEAVLANETYIKSETLTETLIFVPVLENGTEIEFDDIKTSILISK